MKNSNKLLILIGLLLVAGMVFSNMKLRERHLENISNEKEITDKYAHVKHIKIKGNGLSLNLQKGGKNEFSDISQLIKVVDLKLSKDTMLIDCLQCNHKDDSIYEYKLSFKMPTISSIEADSATVEMMGFKENDFKIRGNKSKFKCHYVEFKDLEISLNQQSSIDFESTSKSNSARIILRDSSIAKIKNLFVEKLKMDASADSKVETLANVNQ
jgi:hypothetical protein